MVRTTTLEALGLYTPPNLHGGRQGPPYDYSPLYELPCMFGGDITTLDNIILYYMMLYYAILYSII